MSLNAQFIKETKNIMRVVDQKYLNRLIKNLYVKYIQRKQKKIIAKSVLQNENVKKIKIQKLQKKREINVYFLSTHPSQWACNDLYHLFESCTRFRPFVILANEWGYGERADVGHIDFYKNKYRIKGSDKKNHAPVINPEEYCIIIYSQPIEGKNYTYCISKFSNALTIFLSYGIPVDNNCHLLYSRDFNKYVSYQYVLNCHVVKHARNYEKGLESNMIETGYIGCDEILKSTYRCPVNHFMKSRKKIIIWAPHHSIEKYCEYPFSNFLTMAEFMLNVRSEFENEVVFVFKPHPGLKEKLYNHPDWGVEKTDNYYDQWKNKANSLLSELEYNEIFLKSDAMILDSISFLSTYQAVKKPICFVMRKENSISKFSNIGKQCLSSSYVVLDYKEILSFINNVVLKGNDPLSYKRELTWKYLYGKFPRGNSSELIFNHINSIVG